MDSIQKKQLGSALGAVPSGCFIMTSGDEKSGTGLLASWVQQCSFDPPMVTVCVKEGRPIEAAVMESGRFVLNIIGDSPGAMFGHFGKGFGPGESAFEGVGARCVEEGVVLEGCVGYLACKVVVRHIAGDHNLYVGQVVGGALEGEGKPYVHVRKNGSDY